MSRGNFRAVTHEQLTIFHRVWVEASHNIRKKPWFLGHVRDRYPSAAWIPILLSLMPCIQVLHVMPGFSSAGGHQHMIPLYTSLRILSVSNMLPDLRYVILDGRATCLAMDHSRRLGSTVHNSVDHLS